MPRGTQRVEAQVGHAEAAPPTLNRALGRWDLTAVGINQVIGAAIFLMPSQIAAQVGAWSPLAFVLIGVASLLVALCFAEVGSRFDATGGPYLFARTAFGRFAGFEMGWMYWVLRVTSWASVANGIALALGFYWPAIVAGVPRALLLTGLIGGLAWINVLGIRQAAWAVNVLTISKLVPLAVFVLIGVSFIEPGRLLPHEQVTLGQASSAALLLIYSYGGYDVITVPAGEAGEPRRYVPFALITTIIACTIIMTVVQMVVLGVLPNIAQSSTPVADGTYLIMGSAGALMIGIGSVVSMVGNNAGQLLSSSRTLFAMGEQGNLPPFFARIHPWYRTPVNAILVSSGVTLALALTGSFVTLAATSGFARLIIYTVTCAATLALRRPGLDRAYPASFVIRWGPVVPVLAILISMAILAGSSGAQLLAGIEALGLGAVLYLIVPKGARNAREAST